MCVYLRGVEDALDLREVGDVPGVLGERAHGKAVSSHKHWSQQKETEKTWFQLLNHQL